MQYIRMSSACYMHVRTRLSERAEGRRAGVRDSCRSSHKVFENEAEDGPEERSSSCHSMPHNRVGQNDGGHRERNVSSDVRC